MQVVRVSGTIKKAEEEAIRRARISIRRAQKASKMATAQLMHGSASATNAQTVVDAEDEDDDVEMGFANGIEDPDGPGDMDEESD